MAKIICEYCGTSYKSTLEECPICGNATPAQPQEEPQEQPAEKKPSRPSRVRLFLTYQKPPIISFWC